MQHRWLITGIVFLFVGGLELVFFALTVLGIVTGGAMGVMGFMEGENEAAFVGGAIFLIYGLWFFCTLIPAVLHLIVGGMMAAGKKPRKAIWAATVASALPLFTVYCAPTSLIAAAAGLVTLLVPDEEAAVAS